MRAIILLFILSIAACDRAEGPGAATESGRPLGDGTTASYDRSFLLLSLQAESPVAAAIEFSAVEAPGAIRRMAGAWLARDGSWTGLLEQAWEASPIREPWRLVPHGPLRLVVGEGDEIEAVIHRADSTGFRLEPSAALAEWGVGDAVQLRLRRGTLSLGRESFVGLVLDLQTGTPVAQPDGTAVAFVTDDAGASLVVARGADGRTFAWLHRDAETLSWESVSLAPIAAEAGAADAPPAGWRIAASTGDLTGELRTDGEPVVMRSPADSTGGARTLMVDGWIEARGDRRDVFGLFRHGLE
ncbi:MAG TPA: hypothetical protein VF212_02415 [Longimicrobiales bacterium]